MVFPLPERVGLGEGGLLGLGGEPEADGSDTIFDFEFVEDIFAVEFDGVLTDADSKSDFPGGFALGEMLQDNGFCGGQFP